MRMDAGQVAVELGCGIGGPGRDVAAASGVKVIGISVSEQQLQNLCRISNEIGSPYTNAVKADMQQLPLRNESVDHVYSINAIYHVNSPGSVIDESYRVLKEGGCFGVDDWFVTDHASNGQLEKLRHNWSTSSNGFHNINQFTERMRTRGFVVDEVVDYTEEAGKFLSEERFGRTYDMQVAPNLLDAFPQLYQYEGYDPLHAEMAVAQLRSDILYMGELYRSGAAVYKQIVAKKVR